jgi:microcin C transport system permease protein
MKISAYILRRCLLMLPTLIGITLITFIFVNLAPGGPLEQKLQKIRLGQKSGSMMARGSQSVPPEVIEAIKRQYGFEKPLPVRYWIWIKNISHFNFGESFDYGQPVIDIIRSRLPVSIQFGVASFFLTYIVSILAGLLMAYHANRPLDKTLSTGLLMASAIPAFAFGVLLLVFFAGGSFLNWFPLGYFQSENYEQLSNGAKLMDRLHHFILPLTTYMLGSFTALAFLTRNSVLTEIHKDYIRTAQAIGLSRWRIFMRHAFRNSLIPVVTGIGGFFSIFLSGSLLVETIFQLNGIGRLGFQALMSRDYNMIMGLTFLQSLALLFGNLIGDLVYILVDPRIDFAGAK